VNTGLAVGAALGSALCFAVSSVLQQRGASRAPKGSGLHLSLLANLLARPMWLGGVLAAVGTVTLQALALAAGPLALVQPLLVSALLFALPASVLLEKRRPSVVEWAWALLLVFGLAVFLRAAQPGTGPALPDDGPLLLMGAVAAAVAVSAAAVGRGPGRRHRAVLLGLATGIMYGLTASLIKYTVALAAIEWGTRVQRTSRRARSTPRRPLCMECGRLSTRPGHTRLAAPLPRDARTEQTLRENVLWPP
jgi:drug/metabolite transporter (DMT)-like permease